jgi:hypothetical protein
MATESAPASAPATRYFKILHPDLIHNGFKFEEGFNKLRGTAVHK